MEKRERIGLVVPPSRVDAFPRDSLLAQCTHTEEILHQTKIFKGTGREMFFKKNFPPCIERK
jgi:hypothetical protein